MSISKTKFQVNLWLFNIFFFFANSNMTLYLHYIAFLNLVKLIFYMLITNKMFKNGSCFLQVTWRTEQRFESLRL